MMSRRNRFVMALLKLAGGLGGVCLLAGCTTVFYKNQADEAVYEILKQVEEDIFGTSDEFTIDTNYTGRKPGDISDDEILLDRSPPREKVVMNIDQAVDYAIAHSREFQSRKESLYLTALNLTGERYEFFPQFFAGTRATGLRQSDGERLGTVNSDIGVTQALLTGANIGVSIANDLLRYYTGDPRESAASVISMNLFQPLLRGAGRKIAGERLKQAHRNVFYAIRDFSHFQNTFANEIVIDYFGLLQNKDQIYNEYNNYLSSKSDTDRMKARSVDRESLLDVAQSEQRELQAKDRYLLAISRFRNAIDQFKVTIGMPSTVDFRIEDSELTRLRESGLDHLQADRDASFYVALEHSLPLLNDIDRFEDRKRQVAIAADRLKADLNILGDASLDNDEGPTDYADFDFNNVRASVGIQLNLPLDRLRERNQYRATLINFEEAIRDLGLTFDQLRNQIALQLRELERLRQSYRIQQEAAALAEERVRGNRLEQEAGTLLFSDLTDSQNALIAAQNAVTNALVDYISARLSFLVTLGILSTENDSYWLTEDAITVNLDELTSGASGRNAAPILNSGEIPSPDQLFPN